MDWFEHITGFRETGYEATRGKLRVECGRLYSLVNGRSYGIGSLKLASLQRSRDRAQSGAALPGRLKAKVVSGDVRKLHQSLENVGALFQVALRLNILEVTDAFPVRVKRGRL